MATSTLERRVSGWPLALSGAQAASTKYTSTGIRWRMPRPIVWITATSRLAANASSVSAVQLARAPSAAPGCWATRRKAS